MLENSNKNRENSKPAYSQIYAGKYVDKTPDIRPAGILTYSANDTVDGSIRQTLFLAPLKIPQNVSKFTNYRSPNLGEIRVHYGHANDPKDFEHIVHGMRSDDKSFTTKDCINPETLTKFQALKNQMSERIYQSNKTTLLGKVKEGHLPKSIDPYKHTFGVSSNISESVKESVNPDKSRAQVELESSDKQEMYKFTHSDYEPGEQKTRSFSGFDRNQRFGCKTQSYNDGRQAKSSLNWLPLNLMDKRAQSDKLTLDEFKEKTISQIGKPLDPNKDTRFLGPDHVFGLTNTSEQYGAGDILHGRSESKLLKGKDKERAFVATARSHLARYNLVKFKTLADAFKFYDKDKDGFISRDELKNACALTGFPIADKLLDSLIFDIDIDQDGKVSFIEFSNFLCYKDSMELGIDLTKTNSETKHVVDDEGRVLLNEKDLGPKNNIPVNKVGPKTIVHQLDNKYGDWKTTYDLINDAPFRAEPIKKRVYGVPSIRNDLVAPEFKKIQDKTNYGNDGNAWSLLCPSIFSQFGVYESDVLKPRNKEEIKTIFSRVGFNLPTDEFEKVWNSAKSLNPNGQVSIEEFRGALEQYH